jgi:TPR repeat protein
VAAKDAGVNDDVCPFCRADKNISEAEFTRRAEEGIKRGDPEAMEMVSLDLCKDGNEEEKKRGNALLRKAANVGLCTAHYRLGCAYIGSGPDFGVVEKDVDKAMFHFETAATAGHGGARYNLGVKHINDHSLGLAAKHFMIGAKSGYKDSMDLIKEGFVEGWVTKTEFEETLRANKESLDELKSEQRDKAILVWDKYFS